MRWELLLALVWLTGCTAVDQKVTSPSEAGEEPHDAGEPGARNLPVHLPLHVPVHDARDAGFDAGFVFGTRGPWPIANTKYTQAHGIRERPVVGTSTDETQNLWVATHEALYLLRPGSVIFQRFDAIDGLHLESNPVAYCDSNFGGGDRGCPIYGGAAPPGISEIVGGGPDEVFIGYYGADGSGDWGDPNRHSGKLDRVRLRPDGTLQVDRFDLVVNNHGAQYWHNRTVRRMAFDHFIHRHDLYVGLNHGVTMLRPDRYRKPNPGEWFDSVNQEYMADHLHPRVCFHAPCDQDSGANQRMGGWRGLAISPDGNLWVAGKWTAGKILWDPSLSSWHSRGGAAFEAAFGDPYPSPPNENGYIGEPVFRPPLEGDPVNLAAVSAAPDGRVWFATAGYDIEHTTSLPDGGVAIVSRETRYGIAVWDGKKFAYFDPVADLGMAEPNVRDLLALPDGRLMLAAPRTGLTLWNPATGASKRLRAPDWLPDDRVERLELDTMVSPPALHVSTETGAAVIRRFPAQ